MKKNITIIITILFLYGCGNSTNNNIDSSKETLSNTELEVKDTESGLSKLQEKGSPLNPIIEEDTDNNNSENLKNAKPLKIDLDNLEEGDPLNAQKMEDNNTGTSEKGSPANPIETPTKEDILN